MSAITKTAASTSFLSTYEEVTRVRIEDPGRFARLAAARKRRTVADTDGTMMIIAADHPARRSEEHTSELQSRGHLVCRLLLEKKNKPHTESRLLPHPTE